MTSKTRLSILLVSTPVLAFVIVGGLIGQERSSGDRVFRHLRVFDDVVQLVISNYVEDVKVDKAMEGALRGLADGLDPDSAYLDTQEVRAVASGEHRPEDVAASFQQAVVDCLVDRTRLALSSSDATSSFGSRRLAR